MLSFLAVAFVCEPSFADLDTPEVQPLQSSPTDAASDASVTVPKPALTPQQQVDSARKAVTLDQNYVLNLIQQFIVWRRTLFLKRDLKISKTKLQSPR
jgi:hypothetical protein